MIKFLVCMVVPLGIAAAAIAQVPDNPVVKRGHERYLATGCWQCHGYEGQGGAAPRLGPEPMTFAAFEAYVRQPAGDMPPYRAHMLPTEDLAAIHAYLASRPPRVALPGAAKAR